MQIGTMNLESINLDNINVAGVHIGAINLLFIGAMLIVLGGFIKGCKQGFGAEISSFISLLVSVAALLILIRSVREYMDKDVISAAMGAIAIVVVVLVYKIAGLILEAVKILSKIPVIKWGDALLGGLVGSAEAIVVIWILFTVVVMFNFGDTNEYVLKAVGENAILEFLFRNNYIAYFVAQIL